MMPGQDMDMVDPSWSSATAVNRPPPTNLPGTDFFGGDVLAPPPPRQNMGMVDPSWSAAVPGSNVPPTVKQEVPPFRPPPWVAGLRDPNQLPASEAGRNVPPISPRVAERRRQYAEQELQRMTPPLEREVIDPTGSGSSIADARIQAIADSQRIESEQAYQEEWAKISDLTGMPTVPTLKIEKTYLVPARDFGSPQHLISIIKNFKESEYGYNYRTFERIKTLNYNIQMAFGRTDKLLRQIENKLNNKQ